jgi:hypothetical protein
MHKSQVKSQPMQQLILTSRHIAAFLQMTCFFLLSSRIQCPGLLHWFVFTEVSTYSLRFIILVADSDVSIHKICLDTSKFGTEGNVVNKYIPRFHAVKFIIVRLLAKPNLGHTFVFFYTYFQ